MSARKVVIQRVAVVEFGVNDRSGDETGCFSLGKDGCSEEHGCENSRT